MSYDVFAYHVTGSFNNLNLYLIHLVAEIVYKGNIPLSPYTSLFDDLSPGVFYWQTDESSLQHLIGLTLKFQKHTMTWVKYLSKSFKNTHIDINKPSPKN